MSDADLLVTRPVRTADLDRSRENTAVVTALLLTSRNLQDCSCSSMLLMSHLASQPASLKSQGCWIFWMMVAATWLTQLVMVTLQVGHTSTFSLHLAQIT